MIYVYNKKKDLTGTYKSLKQAADATSTTTFQVAVALQNKVKTLNGLIFTNQELIKFKKSKRNEVQVSVQE